MVIKNIDELLANLSGFYMLDNFWTDKRVGSGLMFWDFDLSAIYNAFKASPISFMNEYTEGPQKWGDQSFIWHNAGQEPRRFQKDFPGKVVSYKMHVAAKPMPIRAEIICFHGKPRPWETPLWRQYNGSGKI
jgi:hypothetical protein